MNNKKQDNLSQFFREIEGKIRRAADIRYQIIGVFYQREVTDFEKMRDTYAMLLEDKKLMDDIRGQIVKTIGGNNETGT